MDGRLYVYNDEYLESLPAGAVLRGGVKQSDSAKLPDQDFAAANVPEGVSICAPAAEPGEQIYVQISDHRYERFVLSN